jgi:hypothetical protein
MLLGPRSYLTKNTTNSLASTVTAIGDNHYDSVTPTPLDDHQDGHHQDGHHQDGHHQHGHQQHGHVTQPAPNDITDWASLRVSQDFESLTGTKTLTTIPVCKPHRQWFFQTHPSEEWHYPTYALEDKIDRETYLVDRPLWSALVGEVVFKRMFAAINRQGVFFFWPVKMPDPNGRKDEWGRTALEFAKLAMGKWVRVVSNLNLGAYEVIEAPAGLSAPVWPELEFPKLLDIAFRERIIRDFNHPVLKRLRGEL